MNILVSAAHIRLDALDVGFPGTVASSVGVRHLNTESDRLIANLAFCHLKHLLNKMKVKTKLLF